MTLDKNPEKIQKMFDLIAKDYDFINDVMSFGKHKSIKLKCVKNLDIKPHYKVIDLCCGTGDIAELIKKIQPQCEVTGVDFSENMLKIARSKTSGIQYIQGDVTNLPFKDDTFDAAAMCFGLRNINNAEKAVEEAFRVLRRGGKYLHLDFGKKNLAGKIYDLITPVLVKRLTENTFPYKYLINSKKAFSEPDDLIKDFERKGFKLYKRIDFMFGAISAQIMEK